MRTAAAPLGDTWRRVSVRGSPSVPRPDPGSAALRPSCAPPPAGQQPAPVVLPVYHHWEFRTGVGGDFASLAAALKPRSAPAELGHRPFAIGAPGFDGKQLRSVAKGEVDLGGTEDAAEAEGEREKQRQDYADLLAWMTERLSETVKEVRLSARLTVSAACIVSDADAITPALENIYRAMGQEVPQVKRILEVNPKHPLITGLNKARAERPDDPALGETAELVHALALLAEGGELADPARFVSLVSDRLERAL